MLFEWLACLLNHSFVFLYTGLIGATVLSVLSPFFRHLSLHGKTRSFVAADFDEKQPSPGFVSSKIHSFTQKWDVQKSYFIHFYIIGLLSLSLGLYSSHRINSLPKPTILLLLLSTHLLRRIQECIYVHQSTPSSKMHVMGYLAGVAHYIWLPFSFLPISCGTRSNTAGMRVERTHSLWVSCFVFLVGLWAQYQQHRHHVLLAHLRATNKNTNEAQPKYRIPRGGWFEWVSCPHYLAEIILYGCFAILSHCFDDNHHERRMNLVLFFVVSNLSVTATRTHRWYCEHCPGYVKLQRHALIPFLF